MTPDEIERQIDDARRQALANFPLTLIETSGEQALAKWQELKAAGQGTPVILGADDESHAFNNLLLPFGPVWPDMPPRRSVDEILKAAAGMKFPDDLARQRETDLASARAWFKAHLAAEPDMPVPGFVEIKDSESRIYTREETIAAMEAEPRTSPLGEWPSEPDECRGLSVVYNLLEGTPLPKVYIGIAPTDDWTTIPAWLRWRAVRGKFQALSLWPKR